MIQIVIFFIVAGIAVLGLAAATFLFLASAGGHPAAV
jgi:hypothetical protein